MEYPSAPMEQEFYFHERQPVTNIKELYDALGDMSEPEFAHFVNDEKHDFANWIDESLNSKFLAARVRRAQTKEEVMKELFMAIFT